MKRKLLATTFFCLAAFSWTRADQALETVQQKLKEQGFYYGEISGQKDADTTAAIRRYQIRNGLQITGELNAETQRSLGLAAGKSSTPPPPRPRATPVPEPSDLREEPAPPRTARIPEEEPELEEEDEPDDVEGPENAYAPGPRGLRPETSGIFDGTPFAVAPPDVQRRVIIGAQTLLTRSGYYRSGIDGVYGPGMDYAVRAYQARVGIAPSGRLDMETLATLGLLPGQRTPGFGSPRRRSFSPRWRLGPTGERVYIPN